MGINLKQIVMRIKWLIIGCLLFTACSKDEIYEPQWGPSQQTNAPIRTSTPISPSPPNTGTPIVTPPNANPKPAISLELDGRLPKDNNGYYHLRLVNNSTQTIHRVTGFVKNTNQPTKVEWENNLFWWLRKGDTIANITKLYINPLDGSRNYVNLPPIINWMDELVPTINKSSYAGTNGEINTVIAPIYKMKGDTMQVRCKIVEHNITKQINIILE